MDTVGFTFLNQAAGINVTLEESAGKEECEANEIKRCHHVFFYIFNYIAVRMNANTKRLLKTICQDAAQDLFRIPLGITQNNVQNLFGKDFLWYKQEIILILEVSGKKTTRKKSQNIEVCRRKERAIIKGIKGFKKMGTRARGKSLF